MSETLDRLHAAWMSAPPILRGSYRALTQENKRLRARNAELERIVAAARLDERLRSLHVLPTRPRLPRATAKRRAHVR